jgi:hypothetical protein
VPADIFDVRHRHRAAASSPGKCQKSQELKRALAAIEIDASPRRCDGVVVIYFIPGRGSRNER